MFLLGWPILSVLLGCSIISLAIILERWIHFRKRKVHVKDFFSKIESVLASSKELRERTSVLGEPMATITRSALMVAGNRKTNIALVADRSVRVEVGELERFVPFLGTIAAASPFIGLLGTVIGIIRAFRSLAMSGGAGPQVVAGGISEALIATALGLMVAIPSLVAYNFFSTKIRRTTENMEICVDGLIQLLSHATLNNKTPTRSKEKELPLDKNILLENGRR